MKNVIGYGTTNAYIKENLSDKIKNRLPLKRDPLKGWIYTHNDAEIIFKFHRRKMTSIKLDISKLLYGDSLDLVGIDDLQEAVDVVSEIIGVYFGDFNFSRLDLVAYFKSMGDAHAYSGFLQKPNKLKNTKTRLNSLYFYNSPKIKESSRVLVFRNQADAVRVEARLQKSNSITANALFKRFVGYEARISELLEISSYYNNTTYFYSLVNSCIAAESKANNPLLLEIQRELEEKSINSEPSMNFYELLSATNNSLRVKLNVF